MLERRRKMGKKESLGINEIVCVAVLIPSEKLGLPNLGKDLPPVDEPERARKTKEAVEESKKHGGVGATILDDYFAILIDAEKFKEKGKAFFDWCDSKGYEPKIANRTVIADRRYMEGGPYEGVVVDIPPQYIDDAIRELILRYCQEVSVTQILESGILMFEGELYPDVNATVMYNRGFIGGGVGHKMAFVSQYPTRDYKRVLANVESSIKDSIKEHKSIRKNEA